MVISVVSCPRCQEGDGRRSKEVRRRAGGFATDGMAKHDHA